MRIDAILNRKIVKNLNGGTKALLAAAGLFAVAAPIAIGLLDGVTVRAQTVSHDLRFEVASVRSASRQGLRSSGVPGPKNTDPGRFSVQLDLMNLVLIAYDLPPYRLTGPDDVFDQQRQFDIEAKMPADTTREQFQRDAPESAGGSARSKGSLDYLRIRGSGLTEAATTVLRSRKERTGSSGNVWRNWSTTPTPLI
jgi:hypothetical protein